MGVAWLTDQLQVIGSGLVEAEHKAEEGAEQRATVDKGIQGKDCQDREVSELKVEDEVAYKAEEETARKAKENLERKAEEAEQDTKELMELKVKDLLDSPARSK